LAILTSVSKRASRKVFEVWLPILVFPQIDLNFLLFLLNLSIGDRVERYHVLST
jgi:hypothetical protein